VTIGFNETLNFPDSGTCLPGTGGTPCADIFSFEAVDLADVIFTVDGKQYKATFFLDFPDLTFDERTGQFVFNGATPCIDETHVCTAENAISEARVLMQITAVTVPAPADPAAPGLRPERSRRGRLASPQVVDSSFSSTRAPAGNRGGVVVSRDEAPR
jgi:hypothetical protein